MNYTRAYWAPFSLSLNQVICEKSTEKTSPTYLGTYAAQEAAQELLLARLRVRVDLQSCPNPPPIFSFFSTCDGFWVSDIKSH
jgi:hypothetical protein